LIIIQGNVNAPQKMCEISSCRHECDMTIECISVSQSV